MVSDSRDELYFFSRLKRKKCSEKESLNSAISDGAAPLTKRRREKKENGTGGSIKKGCQSIDVEVEVHVCAGSLRSGRYNEGLPTDGKKAGANSETLKTSHTSVVNPATEQKKNAEICSTGADIEICPGCGCQYI